MCAARRVRVSVHSLVRGRPVSLREGAPRRRDKRLRQSLGRASGITPSQPRTDADSDFASHVWWRSVRRGCPSGAVAGFRRAQTQGPRALCRRPSPLTGGSPLDGVHEAGGSRVVELPTSPLSLAGRRRRPDLPVPDSAPARRARRLRGYDPAVVRRRCRRLRSLRHSASLN